MKENHIVNLLESRSLGSLSVAELEMIQAHTTACSECLLAYQAAQASLRLLQERASVTVEPSPFFQTKVMAAIRERKLAPKRLGFLNVWQTARPVVASMGAFVAMLLALTFFNSFEPPTAPSDLASVNDSAPEWVIVDSDDVGDEMTYSQALTVLYDPTTEAGDADGK
jgi:anti-sigma factor RsiW